MSQENNAAAAESSGELANLPVNTFIPSEPTEQITLGRSRVTVKGGSFLNTFEKKVVAATLIVAFHKRGGNLMYRHDDPHGDFWYVALRPPQCKWWVQSIYPQDLRHHRVLSDLERYLARNDFKMEINVELGANDLIVATSSYHYNTGYTVLINGEAIARFIPSAKIARPGAKILLR